MGKKVLWMFLLVTMLIGTMSYVTTEAKAKTSVTKSYKSLTKKQNKNTGKFNIGKYGLVADGLDTRFYINDKNLTKLTTIESLTKMKCTITGDNKKVIDVKNDKSIYKNNALLYFTTTETIDSKTTAYYPIYLIEPGTSYLKNCNIAFGWYKYNLSIKKASIDNLNKDRNTSVKGYKIQIKKGMNNEKDYFFNKNFSIAKAPSYDNFVNGFLKKIKGTTKVLDIRLSDDNLYWIVTFPIIDYNSDKTGYDTVGYFQMIYGYNKDTRECDNITYQWYIYPTK